MGTQVALRCVVALAILAFSRVVTQANVFNMPSGQTGLETVVVGDPGNVPDQTGFGAVSYQYSIGKFDVTNAQYTEFLNAKASNSDPYGLYSGYMATNACGGIVRSDTAPYLYSAKPGHENQPVVYASWYDAVRFANWLTNGQGDGDTESGAYAITGSGPNWSVSIPNESQRAAWASGQKRYWMMNSENEWYKAAYYKGGSMYAGYWPYPNRSDDVPTSQTPPGDSDSANFKDPVNGYAVTQSTIFDANVDYLTDVGVYSQSYSAYGTFDQGGNAWQWIETDMWGIRGDSLAQYS